MDIHAINPLQFQLTYISKSGSSNPIYTAAINWSSDKHVCYDMKGSNGVHTTMEVTIVINCGKSTMRIDRLCYDM